MVSFVQQQPDINPDNTAFWARGISEPKADVSKGTLYKGVGEALGEGIRFADQYVREGIVAPTAQTQAGQLHDQFVDALNTAKQYIEQGQAAGAPTSLLPQKNQEGYPTQVANAGDRVDLIQKAMESGKLSETDYYARINSLAKQLRSQFPGYKDEVDAQIARVTGVHSANAQLRSQVADLNRMITQHGEKRDEFTKILDRMADKGLITGEESAMYSQQYGQGKIDAAGIRSIEADRNFREAQRKKAQEDFKDIEQSATLADQYGVSSTRSFVSGKVANALENEQVVTGEFAGTKTSDLLKLDPSTVPSELWAQQSAAEKAQIDAIRREALAEARKARPENGGLSWERMLKPDHDIASVIEKELEPYKQRAEMTGGKDMDFRVLSGHLIQSKIADIQHLTMEDPHVASNVALADLVRKNYGDQTFQAVMQTDSQLMTTIPAQIRDLFMRDYLTGITQPRPGKPYELKDQLQDFKNSNVQNDEFPKLLTNKALERLNDKDTNPKVRRNTIDYLFGPNSGSLISVATKGQYDLYSSMFTPMTARTIAKTAPDKYDQFQISAEQNARTLFTNDLNALKSLPPDLKISWHGDHFEWTKEGETAGIRPPHEYLRSAVKSAFGYQDLTGDTALKNVNTMLAGLKPVFDNNPNKQGDVETFMLARLVEMGFNPLKNPTGIPEQFMTRLKDARQGTTPEQRSEGMPTFSTAEDKP